MSLIQSISGIRGTIGGATGSNLTPVDMVLFGAAYAYWLKQSIPSSTPKVIIGRDARISGTMVNFILKGTLMSCGVDVMDIGLATTPTTEMAVIASHADGGVILTASHNPKQWNALKLLNANGEFLSAADGAQLQKIIREKQYQFVEVDCLGHDIIPDINYLQLHVDRILQLPLVHTEAIRDAGFSIVVDGINSVGGIAIPYLLERLGVQQVFTMNGIPDGCFAHNPEPIPENLTDVAAYIKAHKADLGIVVDPDVDRLAFVHPDGTMFGEEYTLVAVADYVLRHTPQTASHNTVSNLSSSRALRDVTEKRGGTYQASAVGEVNVVDAMKATHAIIGGEGNGGVIYPELHYGRDALVGVALFLSFLAEQKISTSDLRKQYPAYVISKNKITLSPDICIDDLLATVKNKYRDQRITDIDGVRIDFDAQKSWVHLRRSNTEPIIRIYAESRTQAEADALAQEVMAVLR